MIDGILNINKPADWTSHDVVAKLRVALKLKKIGHGGTLDPMATGVLPIFTGKATRCVQFFENADKEYIAGIKFGMVTDTQDITGNVISNNEGPVSKKELADALIKFKGAQKQIPPMYSAIKIDGKKLYELARKGVEVERPARDIHIYGIELLDTEEAENADSDCRGRSPLRPAEADCANSTENNEYFLRVSCSKGTYIRTLCHDIGQALGVGAVMSSLQRTVAGGFSIDTALTLEETLGYISSNDLDRILLPADTIFSQYGQLSLGKEQTEKCKNGVSCLVPNIPDGKYRVYGFENEFLMFGEIISGKLKMIKGFY